MKRSDIFALMGGIILGGGLALALSKRGTYRRVESGRDHSDCRGGEECNCNDDHKCSVDCTCGSNCECSDQCDCNQTADCICDSEGGCLCTEK